LLVHLQLRIIRNKALIGVLLRMGMRIILSPPGGPAAPGAPAADW
jgi:hypothetical protein